MHNAYPDVITRFLAKDERQILSEENEMPLVIEAKGTNDLGFLKKFLATHSTKLKDDLAKYGALLLRGFDVRSDEDFENTVLSIQGFRGISEAFMSEQGRIHVDKLKYVLHTNAVYKTGGTLYLGGFHSENYYSPDVPSYICFCCLKPSTYGGETGLVNMEKVYQSLNDELKASLEKHSYLASKWLLSDVVKRYKISLEEIEKICADNQLPIVGKGKSRFIVMYKPSVFESPLTKKTALQINLFEIPALNAEMRKCFMGDYQGKAWFWHRVAWRLPHFVLKAIENIYISFASVFYSPKESYQILRSKLKIHLALKRIRKSGSYDEVRVGSCFKDKDVKELAKLIRSHYSSCLWKPGDILLVDNKKVAHAGMPGAGPRLVRAMICDPLEMKYHFAEPGYLYCETRVQETIGHYMTIAGSS